MGLGSFFSSGGSNSTSASYSGLRGPGYNYGPQIAPSLISGIQSGITAGQNMFLNPQSYLQGGLYAEQNAMLPTLVNLANNQFSGSAGLRGQLSPENTGAIVGGATKALAPNLFAMIAQNIGDIRNQGVNLFGNTLGQGVGALGSESTSTNTSRGPGIGYNMANEFFKNAMEGFSAPKMMQGAGYMMGGAGGMI